MASPQKSNVRKFIKESTVALSEVMRLNLQTIGENMVAQTMARARAATPAKRNQATNGVLPVGINAYKDALRTALAVIAAEAIDQARKEVPKAKDVRLAAWDETALHLGEFDNLPPDVRNRINKQMQLMVDTQMNDLQKSVFFQFDSSVVSTDSMDLLETDLLEALFDHISGQSVEAGAGIASARTINEARSAFFFNDEVSDQIEAFEFVNGDPVSPICQDLAGTVFAKDDPNAFRYTPPLHWNCKSYIAPILTGNLGNKQIDKLAPSKSDLERYIQFSETLDGCTQCGHA
jgi:hypothetical protein